MPEGYWLRLALDWYDEGSVAAFEPAKVLRRLRVAFPSVEINPADSQRERLEFELAFWAHRVADPDRRAIMVRSSWGLYARTGPTFTFVISLGSGARVAGSTSRSAVTFKVPPDVPDVDAEPLSRFLQSLGMGQLKRHEPMRVDVPASAAHRVYPPAVQTSE